MVIKAVMRLLMDWMYCIFRRNTSALFLEGASFFLSVLGPLKGEEKSLQSDESYCIKSIVNKSGVHEAATYLVFQTNNLYLDTQITKFMQWNFSSIYVWGSIL
jgi:hypothetical protein